MQMCACVQKWKPVRCTRQKKNTGDLRISEIIEQKKTVSRRFQKKGRDVQNCHSREVFKKLNTYVQNIAGDVRTAEVFKKLNTLAWHMARFDVQIAGGIQKVEHPCAVHDKV